MDETFLRCWVAVSTATFAMRRRLRGEDGEGVISTAIAVLIMALIGLAMWQLFDKVFTDAGKDIETNVNEIG